MSTKVKCKCVSKKESINYNKNYPVSTAIELQVPYDQSSVYFQLSGGTAILLNTVNQEAAAMFIIDSDYDVIISPAE